MGNLLPAHDLFACGRIMPLAYNLLPCGDALGRLRISSSAAGRTDCWRAEEDRAAAFGNTLSAHACAAAGLDGSTLERWFRGIYLGFRSALPAVALRDYPYVQNRLNVAAAELDWLATLGKIQRHEEDCAPPGFRVRLSRLIAKGGKFE